MKTTGNMTVHAYNPGTWEAETGDHQKKPRQNHKLE